MIKFWEIIISAMILIIMSFVISTLYQTVVNRGEVLTYLENKGLTEITLEVHSIPNCYHYHAIDNRYNARKLVYDRICIADIQATP